MSVPTYPTLKWTSQFTVSSPSATPFLKGDKIVLPPSALEQLLSAATVTVTSAAPPASTFDPYNPYSVEAERQARPQIIERQQELPHPLTFRLVNPENGRVVYTGVREFSAPESQVGLSPFLRHSLGLNDQKLEKTLGSQQAHGLGEGDEDFRNESSARVAVHFQQLPKGTYVRLRPLEAGYDPEDWKALLEKNLRDNFTTLTNGEILVVPVGKGEFRFLIDQLQPNNDAVSLVDTDLEVDIEALNEEQARETLQQRTRKAQRTSGTVESSSAGGNIMFGSEELGQVRPGDYVDYTVQDWDRSKNIELELIPVETGRDVELFVTPAGPKQRTRPREDEYVFGDFSVRQAKRTRIQHTNPDLENAEALWVSVYGYQDSCEEVPTSQEQPIKYYLRARFSNSSPEADKQDIEVNNNVLPNSDEERCKNCHQLVPHRTVVLHENFCFRNNILCLKCNNVFQKSSLEWKNHWHCPNDSSYGNGLSSRRRHEILLHTSRPCPNCDYHAANTPDLAHHRTTTCPEKQILCSFCHLQVSQQGPDDPPLSDPEVILSGLTPHELVEGARTTECHLCGKIVRLRDMSTHLKHHEIQRLSRPKPRICRNVNCGRTLDGVGRFGKIKHEQPSRNELSVCDACFGPLYVSMYDPEGKALKRRVERKYLTQFLTGCGQSWCRNEYCKTGRKNLGLQGEEEAFTSKAALGMIQPFLERLKDTGSPVHFCTDEASQKRRALAEMVAAEAVGSAGYAKGKEKEEGAGSGYDIEWCVTALEAEGGDLNRATEWLRNWAPRRQEGPRWKPDMLRCL